MEIFDPERECLLKLGTVDDRTLEKVHWQKVNIKQRWILPPYPKRQVNAGISTIKITRDCYYFVVAWTNGIICVYDYIDEKPMLLACTNDLKGQEVINFSFPLDGVATFLAIMADGVANWFVTLGTQTKPDKFKFVRSANSSL